MKVRIVHAIKEDSDDIQESVAIIEASDSSPDSDFFMPGYVVQSSTIVEIKLPVLRKKFRKI